MNLLEHYIDEIYSEEKIEHEDLGKFVKVSMKVNCYGRVSDTIELFPEVHWEVIKKQGYYMA